MFTMLSKENCDKIVRESEVFYRKEIEVKGFKVCIYNYRLANYTDFVKNDAFELRGITFIQQYDGGWRRFLGLHKFFNVNQTQNYMYEDIKDKGISMTQTKLDGSMIMVVQLPNGEVIAKTKMGFDNEQAETANDILSKNEVLTEFCKDCLNNDLSPIFEFVSPFNRIVVEYEKPELRLLHIRDNATGEYFAADELMAVGEFHNIKLSGFSLTTISVDDLMKKAETAEDTEGWVITLQDGQMVKVKTDWYCRLHRLMTDTVDHENIILEQILEETIDDVLGQLESDNPVRKFIETIERELVPYITQQVKDIELHRRMFDYEFKGTKRKEFVDFLKAKNYVHFPIVMKLCSIPLNEVEQNDLAFEEYKKFLINKYNKLDKARDFLYNIVKVETRKSDFNISFTKG
jgi:T4 RnlA family RNA ligase